MGNDGIHAVVQILEVHLMYKQPSYIATRCNKELLRGNYRGFEYRIMDLGTHPTAYVKIPRNHPYYKKDWSNDNIDIEVHGGITYSRNYLTCEADHLSGWWIGWDYAHYGDHLGWEDYNGKRWTTMEILNDVKYVIDQCVEVIK